MHKARCSGSVFTYIVVICLLIVIFCSTRKFYHIKVSNDGLMMASNTKIKEFGPIACNVTLMGQFNSKSKHISTWINIWSKHIKDIVIATPEGTSIEAQTCRGLRCRIMFFKDDRGRLSPYSNILRVLKEDNSVNSLLYVHDDLLITGSTLRRIIGRHEWISTMNLSALLSDIKYNYRNSDSESDNIITLYRNGTSFARDRNWNVDTWGWWGWDPIPWAKNIKCCRNKFMDMFNDTVVEPYLQKSKEDDEDFINVSIGQADMLYLNLQSSEQRLWLINIFELFEKHSMMVECAIPTAVFWMKTRFGIEVHNANLCTAWDGLRDKPGQMIKRCNNKGIYDAFHPVKMGLSSGSWNDYFNAIIKR